jgi:O-antigen/teichoic acid export membrane protein
MKHTVFFGSAMFIERFISFLLLPMLTKTISQAEYAIWSQLIIISGIMVPIILLGFQSAIIKYFPLWDKNENVQHSILLSMFFIFLCLLMIVVGCILFFQAYFADIILGDAALFSYMPLFALLLVSEVLFEFLVAILRAKYHIITLSFYLLSKGIWRFGILFIALIAFNSSFYQAFIWFVSFQFIVAIIIYLKEINFIKMFKVGLHASKKYRKEIMQFSLPLVWFSIFLSVNNFADRFILLSYYDLEMVAKYSAAFSLAAVIVFFYSILGFTLFPTLSKYFANKNFNDAILVMNKIWIVYFTLFIPYVVLFVVASEEISLLLLTKEYVVNTYVLILLIINAGLFGIQQISFYPILVFKDSSIAYKLAFLVISINIIFNLFLIPKYGLLGAAIAGFISNSFFAGASIYVSKKSLNWQFPWIAIFKIILKSSLFGGLIWLFLATFSNVQYGVILSIILSGGFYILFDFLDKKHSIFAVLTDKG